MDVLSAFKVAPAALLYAIQPLAYSLLAEYGLDWDGDEDKDFGLTVVALTSTVALLAEGPLVVVILLELCVLLAIEDDLFCSLVNDRDFWVAKVPFCDLTIELPLSAFTWAIISFVLCESVPGLLDVDTALSILVWRVLPFFILSNISCAFPVICCLFNFVTLAPTLEVVVLILDGLNALVAAVVTLFVTVGTVALQFTLLSSGFTLLLVKIPFTSAPFKAFVVRIFSILLTLLTTSWDFLNLAISAAPLFFNALPAFGIAHLPILYNNFPPSIAPFSNPSSIISPSISWEAETVSLSTFLFAWISFE